MQLTYWTNFIKRKNSTAQPTGGTTISNVRLKDDTTLLNPTFILTTTNDNINYVRWSNRYYFVNNITRRNNNISEISCKLDDLATHKTEIGNYTAFVERAASSYDDYINDPMLTQRQSIAAIQRTTTATQMDYSGCYVVRVIGKHSGSVTGIGTFAITSGQLVSLLTYAFGDILNVITNEAVKAIFNPFDYIVSCKWFPFSRTTISDNSATRIWLGHYDTGVNAYPVDDVGHVYIHSLSRGNAYYNDFRDNNASYTKIKMLVPTIGLVECDPIYFSQSINYIMLVDWLSGASDIILENVVGDTHRDFMHLHGNASADIQIAQTNLNGANIVSDVIGATANIAVGNYVTAAAETVDAVRNVTQPTQSILGSQNAMSFLKECQTFQVEKMFYGSKDFHTNTSGRCLYKNVTLNTLSGYIKCANASVPIAGTESEKDAINNYLNTGFYYE